MAWTLAGAVLALATFAAAGAVVSLGRRRPPALVLVLAFSMVVAFEAVLAPLLSLARAYARGPVLFVHLVAIAAAAAAAARVPGGRDAARRLLAPLRRLGRTGAAASLVPVVVLGGILVLTAAAYVPNNWDSMTYRLARVAHWIQHRSVEPYPSGVNRQFALAPGAEYVLAAWQVVARSDRLANFLQLAAWAVTALAAAPLLRVAGARRGVARLGVAVAAAVPMAVLQATSTQNDLVAAAACLAAIAASLPYLGRKRTRPSDAALLGMALAVAALVKPSAVVVAAPFVAFALGVRVARAARGRAGALARTAGIAAAVAVLVSLPDAAVRLSDPGVREANAGYAALYLYPPLAEARDRLANLARGVGRHFPLPLSARAALDRQVPAVCVKGPWCEYEETRAHEDCRGNPLHVLFVGVLVAVALLRWRSLPRRGQVLLALTITAWALFQLTFRDNPWLTRLESPTFALSPLALVALSGIRRGVAAGAAAGAAALLAAVLLAGGFDMALHNEQRPLEGTRAALRDPDNYYVHHPALRPRHDRALAEARRRGCKRLGLHLGGDSWDYPLTWRAMRAGMETRHVFGADPWPCLVFADGMPPPRPEWGWTPAGPDGLFENGPRPAGYSGALRPTP